MPSNKATQTRYINDVDMADAETSQPSYYNHPIAPRTTFFSFCRKPTTVSAASHTPPTQQRTIQHFPSPAPTDSTWDASPCLRSPSSPLSPLERLAPGGHGPCNRCGTSTSCYFYQSNWEPDRECCYECWEADRRGRRNDTLQEFRRRYYLPGVSNDQMTAAMAGKPVLVVSEGWGMAVLGPVEEWRGKEVARKAEQKAMKSSADAEVEEGGDEIGAESLQSLSRDEVVAATDTITAPADSQPPTAITPAPPSARFWDYKTETMPEPGFKETPVEVLDKLTRSGKIIRSSN